MDAIPLGLLAVITFLLLFVAIEIGYRVGNRLPENLKREKEKITSSNATVILGTLGFLLVFTFGIVYSRYDSKRELVREEANIIRTAWLRSDFLPETDRAEAERLLLKYVDQRIELSESYDLDKVPEMIKETQQIQKQLWNMAVENARKDMNSDVAALYIESLNDIINQQATRIAVGVQARIPLALWILLYLFIVLGMFATGYESAIVGSSKRSWLTPVMMLSFVLIIVLVASLDRTDSSIMRVSQQPIFDLKTFMESTR